MKKIKRLKLTISSKYCFDHAGQIITEIINNSHSLNGIAFCIVYYLISQDWWLEY